MAESLRERLSGLRGQERANARARAVRAAAGDSPQAVHTHLGVVDLLKIEQHEEDGKVWVEVTLAEGTTSGETHFRIFNPPTLAEHPEGERHIGGRRFKEDPLLALAQTIAAHGGARGTRKARRI